MNTGRRALIGSGALLALAIALANALNAILQFALARILDPAEFSLVAALFVVILIAGIPPLAFQATVAREVAVYLAKGEPAEAGAVLLGTLRGVLTLTSALLALTAVAAVPMAVAVGGGGTLAMAGTAATAAIALAVPGAWGGLQGARQFAWLSGGHVLFAGTRLVAGLTIALAGGGAGAVMAGLAAATAVTFGVSLVPLRGLLTGAAGISGAVRGAATRGNLGAALGLTTLTALTRTDLLVAKLAFSDRTAGAYAAASIGAYVLLLVPIAVTTVLFPRVATLRDRQQERAHLLGGLGAVALGAALLVAFFFLFAGPLLDATFGPDYSRAEPWLGPLSVAMALYALATVYLYHFLSLARARFALVLVGLLGLQLVLFAFLHERPGELIGVQIGIGAASLAAAELWHLRRLS